MTLMAIKINEEAAAARWSERVTSFEVVLGLYLGITIIIAFVIQFHHLPVIHKSTHSSIKWMRP
jgi:uncharacterized membrane protein